MMQPPRQIVAMSPFLMSQPYSLGAGDDRVEALRVGDDLRGVERLAHVLDEGVGVGDGRTRLDGPGQAGRRGALRGLGGQRAGEHGLGDAGDRARRGRARSARSTRRCPWRRPGRGSTSTSGLPVSASDLAQHLGGDLDQVALELALVPLGEDVGDLGRATCRCRARMQVVGLGDQLHVGVLDAVVHHLHEVAGAVGADVGHAGLALGDRGDRLEDRAERLRRPRRSRRA